MHVLSSSSKVYPSGHEQVKLPSELLQKSLQYPSLHSSMSIKRKHNNTPIYTVNC